MKRERKVVLAFIGSIWLAMPLYMMLHEGGHALIASLCGAKITRFNLLEGYVIAEGGTFSEIGSALFYIAGMLVPVLLFAVYLTGYQSETDKVFCSLFSAVAAGKVLFSIGVWIIIPLQYMLGMAKPIDDAVKFIEVLRMNPLTAAAAAALLMSIYSWAIWRKRIFQNAYKALTAGGK